MVLIFHPDVFSLHINSADASVFIDIALTELFVYVCFPLGLLLVSVITAQIFPNPYC